MTNSLLQDLRYGIRMLVNRPGFTIGVVLTLALGMGANAAIFSVVEAVLLRPLPFSDPDRIVLVRDDLTGRQLQNVGMSVNELEDLQQRSGVFEEISAVWPVDANLTGSDRPERIELLAVSPNYFKLLGVGPQLGRVFGPEDKAQGFAESVVISDGLWKRLFGGDPNVLGRRVRADNDLYTIVGVMPSGFRHPDQTLRNDVEMWATAGFSANPFGPPVRAQRILPGAIGRLKPELDVRTAQAKLTTFISNLRAEFPNDYPVENGWAVNLTRVQENLVGKFRRTLLLLLAAVGVVLLIGCVNIANLMLARSSVRQREMAIRLALGASRRRLIVQLLTESLVLAFLGGAAALLVVAWVTDLLLQLVPANVPRLHEVGFSWSVVGFTLLVSIVTGILFGLVPAVEASRPNVVAGLKEGAQGAGFGARFQRFRGLLVVIEVALSLVLMIGAGLLLRSFWNLLSVDLGFNPDRVLMARIWLPVPNNPELDPYRPQEKRAAFAKEVLQRVSGLPGVQSVAIGSGNGVPLVGPHGSMSFVREGAPADVISSSRAKSTSVSPDYFRLMEARLVTGRIFSDADDVSSSRVLIVDETMARQYWPGENAVGKRIQLGRRPSNNPFMTIIGVVSDIKTGELDRPHQPHLYFPLLQNVPYAMAVYVRASGQPENLIRELKQQIQVVDPQLPVFGERTLDRVVSDALAERRFAMQVVGLFGIVALLLAAIGIYSVTSYSVTQRTREIGVRLALGATGTDIVKWVLRQGMVLSLTGVGTGIVCAAILTRLMHALLFGVAPIDLLTYAGLGVLLIAVTLVACYLPARRATKTDPLVALRHE